VAFIAVDGTWRVSWVTSIANIQAPTAAELTAGLLLTANLTPDGVQNFQPATATIPTSSLADTFDTVGAGRTSFGIGILQFYKQPSADTAYTTLIRNAAGFVAIRRYIATGTAYTAAQPIQIYPAICGDPIDVDIAVNEAAKWQAQIFISAAPALKATVA
jgi:hypothetical protein